MKIYPPERGLTNEEIRKGHWSIYADVKCIECGLEQALSNTINGKCKRCGGECG